MATEAPSAAHGGDPATAGEQRRPSVGMVYNFSLRLHELIQELRPDIKIDVVVSGDYYSDYYREEKAITIPAEEKNRLQAAEILLVDPFILVRLGLSLQRLPRVGWMHSVWDGVDQLTRTLDSSLPKPQYILTRNGGYFGPQMAEYVMGMIVAHERRFVQLESNQRQKIWDRSFSLYRNVYDLSIGIIGLGDIGKEVARLAKAFRMTVWAVVRSMPSEEKKCPDVSHYRLYSELHELLAACDYICVVLPSVPTTDGLLDGSVLEPCKNKKSVLMNIGRGNVVKNSTIINALDSGWLGHAILDVMETEPLPPESPLWTHPGVTLTPHICGSAVDQLGFVTEFIQNYDRYVRGEPLTYQVDWDKGY